MSDDLLPFQPNQLDELLSAELDGELDGVAAELGLRVEDVAARIEATPGAETRRVELAAARDLLAEPVEIDELVAARLRTNAVRAADEAPVQVAPVRARESHRAQWLLRSAGIAAAIAALFAVVFAIGGSQSSSKSASSGAPAKDSTVENGTSHTPKATPTAPTVPIQALGSFTTAHDLALAAAALDLVRLRGPLPTTTQFANGNGSQTATQSTLGDRAVVNPAPVYGSSKSADRAAGNPASAARTDCPVPADVPIRAKPTVRGTAILSGKPVFVTVYAGNGEHIVVVQDTNCMLLNLQMFG